MKALTVCNPHSWALIYGDKPFENRNWPSPYRGLLAIHAGASTRWLTILDQVGQPSQRQYVGQPAAEDLIFGCIIGVVRMVACKRPEDCGGHPTATGPWCFEMAERVALAEPVPCSGSLGFWEVPEAVARRVEAQLQETTHV